MIDYHALAIRLLSASPLACALLAVQTESRKIGLSKTSVKTLIHKAKELLGKRITLGTAEGILHIYSEHGIGAVATAFGTPEIHWNPSLDMKALGEACRDLRQRWRAVRNDEGIGRGKTVVCMLPSSSLKALQSTELAKLLEIELLKR